MIQGNYFNDNEDLQLQFQHILDWPTIVQEVEQGFHDAARYKESGDERLSMAPSSVEEGVEYYRTILESAGEMMGQEVAPRSAEMDQIGLKYKDGKVTYPPALDQLYNLLRDAGLMPFGIARRHGGLGLPFTAQAIILELSARADAAFALAYGNINVAEIVERYGSAQMVDEWMPKWASAEISCAMALTEPNYGSDLPSVQTKAVKGEDGVWRLTGTKRFITHASGYDKAPCVILTLARSGSPTSGARGLSFFLVHSKDVHVASIERKMGLHCSPTCEVVYDNSPGLLIGEEGLGLVRYSMGMMNTARLVIAAQSLGIAEAARCEARKYASERVQFGKAIEKIPAVKKMVDRMDAEAAGIRAIVFEAARCVDNYLWRKEHLHKHGGLTEKQAKNDAQVGRWEKLADLFTPLSKYYASETCVKIAYDAVQIHGGSGFTEDYDVSRIYRDARITTIYEGTTQLQVVAAIGGVTAGMANNGFLRAYIDEELKGFSPSATLQKTYKEFEGIAAQFRSIDAGDVKARYAFEAVESAARFLIGMLLERSLARIPGDARAARQQLADHWHEDTLAILAANRARLDHVVERAGSGAAALA
ncbi:MAG: acyl-CoA dehydrogenase family protein [Leptospirales bacterium]|nr:acyl-CoA dehydrogenase family protein [Leptospirales bacterium]